MSLLTSIKVQAILLIALLVIVPVALAGGAGTLYYREVFKQEIWDNNLAQAKAVSALVTNYIDLAQTYLKGFSDRPLVVKGMQERDVPFLDFNARYIINQSKQIDSVFFTDTSGTVLASYPDTGRIGQSYLDRPYVSAALNSTEPVVSRVQINEHTGRPTIYIGAPILDSNGTAIGTLVGTVDLVDLRDLIVETQAKSGHYVYLVNKSGRVMVHSNDTYMNNMTDFTTLPAVSEVIRGEEGVVEQQFPFESDYRLVAFTPVDKYGWGVIVATPIGLAYRPIDESTGYFLAFLLVLLLLSLLIAALVGKYLTDPILRINGATAEIPDGDPARYEKTLPLHRKDEIGNLARSFLAMAATITADRERVLAARNQAEQARSRAEGDRDRAEEEKNRAELYVDIMGHDINNLNQIALTNLELLEIEESLTPDQRETIEDALIAVRGSASVIDSVRTIQRATEEKIAFEPVDLNDLITQCIREAPRPKERQVTIEYQPRPGLIVQGSKLLKAVFCNLIGNAIKHSTKDVTIWVSARESEKQGKPFYDIAIEDNGPGISDGLKPKLFARFQRGTTKAKGRGLGLFIVRTLTERFGGKVTVEDRVPGDYTKGSRFIVSLPRGSQRER